MPFYDYECKSCKYTTVLNMTFAEKDAYDKKCPECGAIEMQQHWPLGTITSKPKIENTSKGGIFSKKFWNRNKWT